MPTRVLVSFAALLMIPGAVWAQAQMGIDAIMHASSMGDLAPVINALTRGEWDADERLILRQRMDAAGYRGAPHRSPELLALSMREGAANRDKALTIMASSAFAAGDYAQAAGAAQRLAQVLLARGDVDGAAAAARTHQVSQALGRYAAQHVEGSVALQGTALRRDPIGLPRIDVLLNGNMQEAVVDTGANLSVLSLATARRLGLMIDMPAGEVANSVGGTVAVRTARADRLVLAGTTLRNVPFLIIDDAQLTFSAAHGYRIQAIIGLPVLRALGRIRMDGDRLTVEAPQARDAARQNLFAEGNNLFLRVRLADRSVPLLLDTGANRSNLSSLFASMQPQLVSALPRTERQVAGAGSERRTAAVTWRDAEVTIAGRSVTVPALSIALPDPQVAPGNYGTLGLDVLRGLGAYSLDFSAMRLEPHAPQN